jgi:hypothetical protein
MKSINKKSASHGKSLDDKVIISSEYYQNDRPSFICSICNQTLVRLTDAGGNNNTYWCRNCSVEWDATEEIIRRESKISVPDRNVEPAVATTPGIPNISLHKEPELSGGFAELANKGTIKFKDYRENIPRPKKR